MLWIVTADWHFKSSDWLRRKEFKAFCDTLLKVKEWNSERIKSIGLVVLGDLFDSGAPVNTDDLYYLLWFFRSWSDPVLVIPGNHDCHVKSTQLRSIFKLFEFLDNVELGLTIPLSFPQFSVWEYYSKEPVGKGEILLSHKDIRELNSFCDEEFGISIKDLGRYKVVFNGHLHYMKTVDNVILPGPPYPTTLSDWKNGSRGSFVIFDDSNYRYRFFGTSITSFVTDEDIVGTDYTDVITSTGTKYCRVITSDTTIRSDGTKVKVSYRGQVRKAIDLVSKDDIDNASLPTIHDACEVGIRNGKLTAKEARILELLYERKAERAISSIT